MLLSKYLRLAGVAALGMMVLPTMAAPAIWGTDGLRCAIR